MIKNEFIERQSFRQWYLWVLLLAPLVLFTYAFVHQVLLNKPFGDKPAPDILLIVLLLFICLGNFLFYKATLTTIINEDGIFYKWSFLNSSFNKISWQEMERYEMIKYDFVGYGIRFSRKYGTVYNVSGQTGLFITKKNKSKVLIGTQKPAEFQQALAIFKSPTEVAGVMEIN